MTRQSDVPFAEITSRLAYNPDTGAFKWKNSGYPNKVGYIDKDGYLQIGICGATFRASHLAFLFMGKEPPAWPDTVNHINRCRLDNRWRNLEILGNAKNASDGAAIRWDKKHMDRLPRTSIGVYNPRPSNTVNKWGYTGVRYHPTKQRFNSAITVSGRRVHLGWYDTPEEAGAVYQAAREMILAGEWDS